MAARDTIVVAAIISQREAQRCWRNRTRPGRLFLSSAEMLQVYVHSVPIYLLPWIEHYFKIIVIINLFYNQRKRHTIYYKT